MKHRAADEQAFERAAIWAGLVLRPYQRERLLLFAAWLRDEAIPAGGLGPHEADRILTRHISDSLVFAAGWTEGPPPDRLVDVGTGVGLPGIPLAISWPDIDVTLLDSSQRRGDLARRAVRILKLPRVEVRTADIRRVSERWPGVVMRAVFKPQEAAQIAHRLLEAGGRAVLGLRGDRTTWPCLPGRVVDVPPGILDEPGSLLIMSDSGI